MYICVRVSILPLPFPMIFCYLILELFSNRVLFFCFLPFSYFDGVPVVDLL